MWRCICGNVQRSIASPCHECGKTYLEIGRFAQRLSQIDLAISLTQSTREEIVEVRKLALSCLANDGTLSDIANQWENTGNPTAEHTANILRNLIVEKLDLNKSKVKISSSIIYKRHLENKRDKRVQF